MASVPGLLSPKSLQREIERFASWEYLAKPHEVIGRSLSLLRPPERISTVECSQKYRYLRNSKGDSKRLWSLDLTPYLKGPMDALDDPSAVEVIMPKPGRTGGTVAFENYAFKLMRFGPMSDILWYLGSDSEVSNYAGQGFKYLFEDHPEIQAKVGKGKSDDNLKAKKVDGRMFNVLQANSKTITNRQAGLMVADEIDTFSKDLCASFLEQTRIRGRMLGNDRKVGITSHPDKGWQMGVAPAWALSSKGIYIMQCQNCGMHASPYPSKYWDGVPRFMLHYERGGPDELLTDRLKLAEETAVMQCPHCKTGLDDKQRYKMVDEGQWMHEGQELDIEAGIIGEPDDNPARGFWIHGLMVKTITNRELARELEAAVAHYDSTGLVAKIRQVMAKVFGEVFEGVGDAANLTAAELRRRSRDWMTAEKPVHYVRGSCPDNVRFITAAVDVGHRKFDVGFIGWDLHGRSWLIDRITLKQRNVGGVMRDLRTTENIEDWTVLEAQVFDRLFPLQGSDHLAMPVALTVIDSGDGNVTQKAYQFARRMDHKRWGSWRKVRCIKGGGSVNAPTLPTSPVKISRDSEGKPVEPVVTMHTLGVHRLKEAVVDRLGIQDGSAGQCFFADELPRSVFDELFNEKLIEGKWVRTGPQETLDIYAYAEAGRQMLEPDREGRIWEPGQYPVWATPVSLADAVPDESEEQSAPAESKPSVFDQFDALNR